MMACAQWIANDFLTRRNLPPGSPCNHDPADCPPLETPCHSHTPASNSADVRTVSRTRLTSALVVGGAAPGLTS